MTTAMPPRATRPILLFVLGLMIGATLFRLAGCSGPSCRCSDAAVELRDLRKEVAGLRREVAAQRVEAAGMGAKVEGIHGRFGKLEHRVDVRFDGPGVGPALPAP